MKSLQVFVSTWVCSFKLCFQQFGIQFSISTLTADFLAANMERFVIDKELEFDIVNYWRQYRSYVIRTCC